MVYIFEFIKIINYLWGFIFLIKKSGILPGRNEQGLCLSRYKLKNNFLVGRNLIIT